MSCVEASIRSRGSGWTLLRTVEISFPKTKREQQTINAQLNALSAETQRLTRLYEQKLAALAELKKSLLHQAFSGQL